MKSRNKSVSVAITLLAAVALGTLTGKSVHGQGQKGSARPTEIKIDNFTFAPGTVTVTPGTTVQWINRDDIPHTVVSEDKTTFRSKALDTDDKFSHTFQEPGTYTYFCSIHPKMTARIVVQ